MCTSTLIKILKPRFKANIKEVQQRLYASIKMGVFDKSNNIINTGIIEQVFQCTTKMILLAKMIKLRTFYGSQLVKYNRSYRLLRRNHQEDLHV